MRILSRAALVLVARTAMHHGDAPQLEADRKNLLVGIRPNRSTPADFQGRRIIRLIKKPILNYGPTKLQPTEIVGPKAALT